MSRSKRLNSTNWFLFKDTALLLKRLHKYHILYFSVEYVPIYTKEGYFRYFEKFGYICSAEKKHETTLDYIKKLKKEFSGYVFFWKKEKISGTKKSGRVLTKYNNFYLIDYESLGVELKDKDVYKGIKTQYRNHLINLKKEKSLY